MSAAARMDCSGQPERGRGLGPVGGGRADIRTGAHDVGHVRGADHLRPAGGQQPAPDWMM